MTLGAALAGTGQTPDFSQYVADVRTADELLAQGDFEGVVSKLRDWPERMPDRAEAHHFLGLAHFRLRDFDDAIRHLSAAMEREKEESDAWKQTVEVLGLAHYFEGRWQDAEPLLEQASRGKPQDSELLYTLAIVRVRAGNGGQARMPFAKIFQVDPSSAEAYALTAELMLQEGRLQDAEELLLRAVRLQPDMTGAVHELGVIALRQGNYDRAAALFRRALAKSPNNAKAWHSMGEALLGLGRQQESVEALKRATWLDSESFEPFLLMAKIHLEQGLVELAEDFVGRAIAIRPRSYEAHFLQSRIYFKTGREELARERLDIAEEIRRSANQPE